MRAYEMRQIVRSDGLSTLSSPLTGHMSKFALLCQAARLLGQVLQHLSSDSTIRDDAWIQLDRTLQSMIAASLDTDSPDHDQISFVYRCVVGPFPNLTDCFKCSALVALYTPWLYSDSASIADRDRSLRAKVIIEQITEKIATNLVGHQCFLGRNPEDMSPWGLFFAYHVCGAHMQSSHREGSVEPEIVKRLKEAFLAIDVRWNVAGTWTSCLISYCLIPKLIFWFRRLSPAP